MALESSRQRLSENIDQQQPPYFFVDKQVLQRCWSKISPLLKIDCLLPHLIGYGFLTRDDRFKLNNYMISPSEKSAILYDCVCTNDERPHLLYMCICEDRDDLGHDEARDHLEKKARELKKTPPAYLQQRGQPGDGDGGGGGQRRDNYGEQRRNDDRHPRQVNQGDESRGRGGQRRESYGEQRRNENRHPQQVVQGDERGRNWGQNDDETREEEESAAGGQPLVPPPSLPHAPCQEGTVAQEDSCVFSGLSSSSAYDNITRNITRETEMYTQDESAEERPIVVEVQEQRETSSACADNLLPQSQPNLVRGGFSGRAAERDVAASNDDTKKCTKDEIHNSPRLELSSMNMKKDHNSSELTVPSQPSVPAALTSPPARPAPKWSDASSYWELRDCEYKGEGTTLMIFDTGIYKNHESFARKGENLWAPQDKLNYLNDNDGHGTLCAGIACGDKFKGTLEDGKTFTCCGVAPNARLGIWKAYNKANEPANWLGDLGMLVEYIHENKPLIDVLVIVSGCDEPNDDLRKHIKDLQSIRLRGDDYHNEIIVVCAASNKGARFGDSEGIIYPARYPETICVGAHDRRGAWIPQLSPTGEEMDFLALAINVIGPKHQGNDSEDEESDEESEDESDEDSEPEDEESEPKSKEVIKRSGTSFAAPAIGGLICLIFEAISKTYPEALPHMRDRRAIVHLLRELATHKEYKHNEYGYGAISPHQLNEFFKDPKHFVKRLETKKIIKISRN